MSDDTLLEPEDSPCKLICSMDRETDMCFGCARTSDEIAYWTTKTKEERAEILAQLPERLPPLTAKLEERRKQRRVNNRRRAAQKSEES